MLWKLISGFKTKLMRTMKLYIFINGSLILPGQNEHRTVHDDQWLITHCWDHYTNDFVFLLIHQSSGYFTFLWDWHRKYRFFQVMEKGLDNISSQFLRRKLFVWFKEVFFLQMWITYHTITITMVIISTTTIPHHGNVSTIAATLVVINPPGVNYRVNHCRRCSYCLSQHCSSIDISKRAHDDEFWHHPKIKMLYVVKSNIQRDSMWKVYWNKAAISKSTHHHFILAV